MKKTNRTMKVLAWTLALIMALPALLNAAALADDVVVIDETKVVEGDVEGQASAHADDGTASLTVTGTVTNDTTAVEASADHGGSVTVNTGDVITNDVDDKRDPFAVGIHTGDNDSAADVTVGDITSIENGLQVGNQGGTIDVTAGDIEAVQRGVDAYGKEGSEWTDLTEEEFNALALGDPDDTHDYDPEDYRQTEEVFEGENGVTYYRYTNKDGSRTLGSALHGSGNLCARD